MLDDPAEMTWAFIGKFIEDAHLGRSEYFHSTDLGEKARKDEIWSKGYPNAYWIVGGSEGWYVHVARNVRSSGERAVHHEDLFIGKFWDFSDAAFSADLLSRLMNGVFKNASDLVSEGIARFG